MNKFWQLLKEGFKGSDRDFTKGPVGEAVILLAIPMVLEMSMESLFALVDIFFVGRLGPQAVAAVGLTESMMTVVYTICFGLSIGTTALVARRVGEQNLEGAARSAAQALMTGKIVSVVLAVIGFIFAADLLKLMGASPEVIEQGTTFTRLLLSTNVVIVMLFIANSILRACGSGAIAMRALWLANGLNIVLCPILIFGVGPIEGFGLMGAAMATTIGRGVGALYGIRYLVSGRARVHIKSDMWGWDWSLSKILLKLSGPSTLQVFIGMASWIGMVKIVSQYGANAVAGYTIGFRLVMFALLPAVGLANAAATMVGQSLGAKDPARAESAVWRAGLYNLFFLGSVGLLLVIFAPLIVQYFSSDSEVIRYAADALRTVAYGFMFYAYGMVLTHSLNGAGDTWTPTAINFFVFWLFEIPLAYALAEQLGWGPHGVFWAITAAFSLLAVVSAWLFRRGHWKSKVV